nr:hypothetical protein [Candidatus Sigynarchaeota archaeon]
MDNLGNKASGFLGKIVVNTTMVTKVGKVNDLFGPVDTPFLSVQLFEDPDQGGILEETFFILMDQGRSSKGKYKNRSKRNT